MGWTPPWTPGLPQRRCPTCRPHKGQQPLVVEATMIRGVCAQCAKRPVHKSAAKPAAKAPLQPLAVEPEALF